MKYLNSDKGLKQVQNLAKNVAPESNSNEVNYEICRGDIFYNK